MSDRQLAHPKADHVDEEFVVGYDGVGESELAFGRALLLIGVARRARMHERVRVGKPDILDRHAHHAAREIARILPAIEHAAEPVERSIGI